MGIIVSWINSAWNIADNQLTSNHPSDQPDPHNLINNNPRHSFDLATDNALAHPPIPRADQHPTPPTADQPISAPTSIPALEMPAQPSSPDQTPAPSALLAPSLGAVDNRRPSLVSADYTEGLHTAAMTMMKDLPSVGASSAGRPTPGSPPATSPLTLRIDVAAANDPSMDHEMIDASFVAAAGQPDNLDDLSFDDEGLSALERIYLFAQSTASFHRVFISRSLLSFLPDVAPFEAVEYVIPLLNCLAMDDEESVKEALVEDLVSAIWWFLTHCQVVDHEVPAGAEPRELPLLSVEAFTPLLGTLLLNTSANINAPARHCVVDLLARIRNADSYDAGFFGLKERKLFEHELVQHVVIGMAHLDSDWSDGAGMLQDESAPAEHSDASNDAENLRSPPPSAADDEILLSTLTSSAHSLATTQFLAQEEPPISSMTDISANIQRPPSPIPTFRPVPSTSAYSTEDALQLGRNGDQGSPMTGVTSLPAWSAEPMQSLQDETSFMERAMRDGPHSRIQAPSPDRANVLPSIGQNEHPNIERVDGGSDFSEEHVAIGKLASMSLIAAVTASGHLDQEYQAVFVKEIERAGYDQIYWVRREATFALGALAKVIPEELLYGSLIPLFDHFCDDSVWNVRQSALFALPAILSRIPQAVRRIRAVQTLQKLSNDPSPQVRTGVLEVLGEIIYLFHEDENGPPNEIVRLFIGEEGRDWHTPDPPVLEINNQPCAYDAFRPRQPANDVSNLVARSIAVSSTQPLLDRSPESDPTRPLICAFNLPAVALTLGSTRWHELRGLYAFLACNGASKVRQTLAASIGEVARIIGPGNARRDLLSRWWDFARGHDPLVQSKVLEALEVFLQVLDPADRLQVVGGLEDIWDNHLKGWREREVLARSLGRLTPLFPDDGEILRRLLRRALRDPAAAVRNATIDALPQICEQIFSLPGAFKLVAEEISSLAYDESFKKRLTYVECSRSLITSNSNYERFMDESFWHSVVVLSSDRISDVRIGLARLLSIVCDKILEKHRTLPGNVLNIVRRLSEDAVGDVRAFVSHLLPSDLGPPTELAYGHALENARSMATFSRPPLRREPRTLVSGMNNMKIVGPLRDREQPHPVMDHCGSRTVVMVIAVPPQAEYGENIAIAWCRRNRFWARTDEDQSREGPKGKRGNKKPR